MRNIPSNEITK